MRVLSLIAIMTVLPGCWSSSPTSQGGAGTTTNAAGVKSMELTAPWKDMNLSIDGGVVESSRETRLSVRFPATPPDVFGGLYEVLKGELVAAGCTFTEENRRERDIRGVFRTPDGKKAVLTVYIDEGRPRARIAVIE